MSFNNFASIAANLVPALEQAVSDVANVAVAKIQTCIEQNDQIDTGFMHDSVHVEDGPNTLSKTVIVGAPYGWLQNYGTRRLAARPFFEPGLARTEPYFQSRLDRLAGSF